MISRPPEVERGVAAWLRMASRPATVRRALGTAALVGTVLVAINHGDAILAGTMTARRVLQAALTVLVPYLVSTASSVATRREIAGKERS